MEALITQQQQAMVSMFIASSLMGAVLLVAITILWGRAATCASMGSGDIAQSFLLLNHKLDRNHDGIACNSLN